MRSIVALFVALCSFAIASQSHAQPTISHGGFSGTMTLHCSDWSPVPSVLPAMTPVNYSSNPSTNECVVSFAGMTCKGRLGAGGACQFGSEDCGGPVGWICHVYYKGVEEGYGDIFEIRCNFPGDSSLSFSYSGSTNPDILGGQIVVR